MKNNTSCEQRTKTASKGIPLMLNSCSGEGHTEPSDAAPCPLCKKEGRHVGNITVRHLLRKELETKAGSEDYYLCMSEKCDIAYYNDKTGIIFRKKDINVPLWFKDDANPRYACYCSKITYDDVIRAVREQKMTDMNAIRDYYDPDAESQCKTRNPTGKCCSAVFNGIIRKAEGSKEH